MEIKLSGDEALILFDLLNSIDENDMFDEAQQRVLWSRSMAAQLEKNLTALFTPNYAELLTEAKRKVIP